MMAFVMDVRALLNDEYSQSSVSSGSQKIDLVCAKNACAECEMTFRNKGTCLYHMYAEHGVKSLSICGTCGFGFRRKSELKKHMQCVHEKKKNFVCNICEGGFYFRKDLTKHVSSVHEKLRPYECEHCGFRFGKREHKTRHIKTMHQFDDEESSSVKSLKKSEVMSL
eukprot:Plantae.Rhodophyta-Purpureofilum_apyrenoidigerum.ctg7692.p2 GENE.Plantae.Rhodophyta-Purpureofilum_apyrenoidigerum.ctg7692~~Plantae.Rhodophyta-Purpureofilum_apyrenoidigerum.ctg7692.p2  ORF type:complete len:167 (-),score=30.83 Plantae.Rhodophyta-Purpureofilum_apyrenoidigerum.ctg7692:186-686(-)